MSSAGDWEVLILGAGIAGILAASVANQMGASVTIVEQDVVPTDGKRPGLPHADHLHNLLGRAQRHLTDVMPGLPADLETHGFARASVADQTHVFELGMQMPEAALGWDILTGSRSALENSARGLLPPELGPLLGRVNGVVVDQTSALTGVTVERARGTVTLAADLVVDALGAHSPLPRLLTSAGVTVAPATSRSNRRWYTSAIVQRPQEWVGRPDFWMTFPSGQATRGGLLSPQGPAHWKVSANGSAADVVPRTSTDLRAFLDTLEDRSISALVTRADFLEVPITYTKPTVTWRDGLRAPVRGYLPIGDAVASLDPLFGQGVSGAAWEADALRRALATGGAIDQVTATYLAASSAIRSAMWDLMTVWDPVDGVGLSGDDVQVLRERIMNDAHAHRAYVAVWHLLAPVQVLTDLASGAAVRKDYGALWR